MCFPKDCVENVCNIIKLVGFGLEQRGSSRAVHPCEYNLNGLTLARVHNV